MTQTRNIDDLINNIPEAKPIDPVERKEAHQKSSPQAQSSDQSTENSPESDVDSSKSHHKDEPKVQNEPENDDLGSQNDDSVPINDEKDAETAEKDEYGNPKPKERTYTQQEVNEMMRKRFSRGGFKEMQQQVQQQQMYTPQQVQQAEKQGFTYDENSDQTWEVQLEKFIENTVHKIGAKQAEKQQKAREEAANAEFEDKFHRGMGNYPDFVETLSDKPVTDAMMMGIRSIENPAAFLYAAAKRQPAELARISKIADPYQQAAEMGRLHERMVKPKGTSNAPKPLSRDRSDISDRAPARVSIEHLIEQDAQSRRRR